MKSFRELKIWQAGRELVADIYRLTAKFPPEERFGLISQMRRAAVSIPSNIAEGFARQSNKEYRQFIFIAMGSCAEIDTQVTLAADLGYCSLVAAEQIQGKCQILTRMQQALINKLGDKK